MSHSLADNVIQRLDTVVNYIFCMAFISSKHSEHWSAMDIQNKREIERLSPLFI